MACRIMHQQMDVPVVMIVLLYSAVDAVDGLSRSYLEMRSSGKL